MEQEDSGQNYVESLFNDNELSRILFENASDAIFFTEELKIIECNEAALFMFGIVSKEQIIGKFLLELSADYQSDGLNSKVKTQKIISSVNEKPTQKLNWEFINTDGMSFEAKVILNSFRHNDRQLLQFLVSNTSLQEKTIARLLKNEPLLCKLIEIMPQSDQQEAILGIIGLIDDMQATLDSAADGILAVSLSGKITNYNKQFKRMFNYSDEILETGEDSVAIEFILNQLSDPDQFVSGIQYLYDHPEIESCDTFELKDGRVLERFSCPQLMDGKPNGRVWNFRDITLKRQAEQQLQLMAHTLKSINESISITDTNNRILFVNDSNKQILGMVRVAVDITERKQAEFELKESEERYRTFFEGSPDAIFLADIETGTIIDANPASAALLKKPLNEIIGIHQTEIHPRKNEFYSHEMFRSDIGKERQNMNKSHENLVLCADGSEIPVEIMASMIHINGKPVLQGVFRNISERKLAEKALQDKEAHLSTLIQTIPDLIWLKDINGVYITCNKMFENFFGASAAEIIGKTDYDFVDLELADFFRRNDLKAIAAGKPTTNEEWITYATDGHRSLLETIKMPMYDSDGTTIGVIGIGRDITARKQAEERLLESEIKYRTLIESMPDGVYRSTPEGKFVEVNPAMVKLLGYSSKEELMAIDIKSELYFNPGDRESLILELNPEELDVYPLKKKDGSAVWVEDHGWYVKDENGKILFHEGISRDVTERKMAEIQMQKYSEELKELNATKDKFFSIIAHDLKGPFNSVIGLSELIKNGAKHLDIATIEQYAGIINSTSSSTYRLLENLLDWARIQQSQILFRPVSLVLNTIVNDVIEVMIEKANSKMIAIINYTPGDLIVVADEDMLKTILRNLISNALKFTSTNGKVEIIAIPRINEIEISIKDTGIGINQEEISQIFKIGSGFSKQGTQNEKGTGLGLMLCKEFVEKHEGKIRVESEPGKGSTFIFTLKQNGVPTN